MTMPFTDHNVQDKIIDQLVEGKKRFSDLVPDGMENSQFMYHMKKLLKDGIVEKDEQFYQLSSMGAQLYNARYRLAKPMRQPSLLIQFLVIEGDKVLLSRRKTALNTRLNEYMLPGGYHYFLATSRSSAHAIARARGLEPGEYLFFVETISRQKNFHGLIDVYAGEFISDKKIDTEFETVWQCINEVTKMTFAQAGSAPYILKEYLKGKAINRLTNYVD